jgi:thymidylate synthase
VSNQFPVSYDANELFLDALEIIRDEGEEVAPRGQTCFEIRGAQLVLTDPTRNIVTVPARKLNYHFMVAEWLWILFGLDDVRSISPYNKRIADFSDDGVTFFGAYGPRFLRDLRHVIKLLREDPDTRQAVINIWRPEALWQETKDKPCTLTWQFFIRRGKLEMIASMRSNDIWLGFPYDLFNFTQIQRYLASCLGVEPGVYVHNVGSLHLYERNELDANRVLSETSTFESPISPKVTFPWPASVAGILREIPFTLPQDAAREMIGYISETGWREYASVLLHRFSKDHNDLGPFFKDLIK